MSHDIQVKKYCKICGEDNPDELANLNSCNGKVYKRNLCKICSSIERELDTLMDMEKYHNGLARDRQKRRELIDTEKDIFRACRKSDRKLGIENDLTLDFIRDEISKGCKYCGESSIRMTLDRIDNSRGHTQDNVEPACLRCNYMRKDMPYQAWLNVAPYVKKAFDQGLFGDWTGQARKCR